MGFKSCLLGKLKTFVSTSILLQIYTTYAIPVIDYSDTLYNGANVSLLNGLQRIQNRCLKHCLKLPILSSTDYVHQEAKLPKLSDRRLYHAHVLGFKRAVNPSFCNVHIRQTRNNEYPVLKYSHVKSSSYEKSLLVFVARSWNDLDNIHKSYDSLSKFIDAMKIILRNSIPSNQVNVFNVV